MSIDYTDTGIDPETGLPLRHRLFADHYLTCLNATKAYRDAGFTAETYGAARVAATTLLNEPNVRSYIDVKMTERAERLGVGADRVLRELAVVAFARIDHYEVDERTGVLRVRPGVPDEAMGAVAYYDVARTRDPEGNEVYRVKLKLVDKLKALHTLCQHLGLVTVDLPPLEVLLNRLPPKVAAVLRQLLAAPAPGATPQPAIPGPGAAS